MGTLITLALSNLATMLMTAWLLHRQTKGQSPIPTKSPRAVVTNNHNGDDISIHYTKGREIL